jgi:CubicO group peptidase (beta-lactamase class C family)
MGAFPPPPEQQVTLANWARPPFNRWGFQHTREIVPSADIPNDPAGAAELPSDPIDLGALSIATGGREPLSFRDVLRETSTDGLVILHRGRVVFEHYAHGMTADTPHILMSVSKSLLGLLVAVLIGRKDLRPERLVTDVIPEVAGTAYDGATIRHLLDMRAGIAFDENYVATGGPMIAYRKAVGWQPRDPDDPPSDLRSFCQTLTTSSGPHGGPFHYVSPNTDLLGWVIERATGQRFADLMSELIWKPLGAERSASITVDRLGAPRCAAGFCATVRDIARVGLLVAQGGARGSAQIVPEACLEDIAHRGDPDAWAAGDFAADFAGAPIRYRSQWYVHHDKTPILFAMGIFGQYLLVHPRLDIVFAQVSSWPQPLDPERAWLRFHAVSRLVPFLASAGT